MRETIHGFGKYCGDPGCDCSVEKTPQAAQGPGPMRYRHVGGIDTDLGVECKNVDCQCHEYVAKHLDEIKASIASLLRPMGAPKDAPLRVVGIDYASVQGSKTVVSGLVRDATLPAGPWKFDQEVTDAFEDMLRRSIPQYDVMRAAVNDVGEFFVRDGLDVFDLGCARGEALEHFVRKYGARSHFVGVDASEPMVEAATRRFEGYIRAGVVRIERMDLRSNFPPGRPSLILAVLTLQFVSLDHRQALLRECYEALSTHGALVVVEKLGIHPPRLRDVFENLYCGKKRAAGYTDEQIERKKLALEGILVPLSETENVGRLMNAGFRDVECFWRWMNFAGFVAVK